MESRPATRSRPAAPAILAPAGATTLLFTTNPGLEGTVVQELNERLQQARLAPPRWIRRPLGLPGHVLLAASEPLPRVWPVVARARSVHHVLRPLAVFPLQATRPLEDLAARLEALEIEELVAGPPFRVTCERSGDHPFTSIDVQRAAGAVLVARYGCPVDLERYAVEVRVDVRDDVVVAGVQLTRRALSHRHRKVYSPRASLKANVAYAMLRCARLPRPGARVLDPFCGSGTILLEAAQLSAQLQTVGCDISARVVEGARANLEAAGLAGRVRVSRANACRLSRELGGDRFDAIVTNPPYGVRMGQGLHFRSFYRHFLGEAAAVLEEKGHLVLLVWRRGPFTKALRDVGAFRLLQVMVVETGGLHPALFVLQRRPDVYGVSGP